jgi:beta-N-acetylglucosaminidase
VRDYAEERGLDTVDAAIEAGMEEMAEEYNQSGRKLYHEL